MKNAIRPISFQGEYALSILLDLSKAFDTVNHSMLLTKLIYYGIEYMENQWFDSYLHKRKQRVLVNTLLTRRNHNCL